MNKNACRVETEGRISGSQRSLIVGQARGTRDWKEWLFIFKANRAPGSTQLAQGSKGVKYGGVAPFLAQLNEADNVLTAHLYFYAQHVDKRNSFSYGAACGTRKWTGSLAKACGSIRTRNTWQPNSYAPVNLTLQISRISRNSLGHV